MNIAEKERLLRGISRGVDQLIPMVVGKNKVVLPAGKNRTAEKESVEDRMRAKSADRLAEQFPLQFIRWRTVVLDDALNGLTMFSRHLPRERAVIADETCEFRKRILRRARGVLTDFLLHRNPPTAVVLPSIQREKWAATKRY